MCLNKKLEINSCRGNNLFYKRSELVNKYMHLNIYMLLWHNTIARTSSKVLQVSLNTMFPHKHNLPISTAFQYLIDVLNSHLDKTSIKQLQVAVSLRMNTAKRITHKTGPIWWSGVIFRFRCYYTVILSFLHTLWLCIMLRNIRDSHWYKIWSYICFHFYGRNRN